MALLLKMFPRRIFCLVCATFLLSVWLLRGPNTKQLYDIHPIEELVIRNRATFGAIKARQSKTIEEATIEYWHRYRREPPKGFDTWFETAQANNFVLIDEFDTFMQSIEPFHGIDVYTLQQRLTAALNPPFIGLAVFKIEGGKAIYERKEDVPKALLNSNWVETIPYNMTVALNAWDVPMISVSWANVNQARQEANHPRKAFDQTQESARFSGFIKVGNQSGWAATSHACSADSPSRQLNCPERTLATPLNFAHNITEARDTCLNCEILSSHGLSLSPLKIKISHDLVPIWAHSKQSHFQDILYPAAYYIQSSHGYDPKLDSPWDEKDNKFYWVGSSTGGRATEEIWHKMHRQRFVIKTNHSNTEAAQFLELSDPSNPSSKYQPRYSTWAEISNLFITRISALVQCSDAACQIQEKVFQTKEFARDPPEAAYSHKFVVDLDGNGHSGRYYRLLQSRSVVVKQTILKEWHDDRLIPWVHFVPLSTGYTELPEMARFLATTDKGLLLSERIARESTEWHDKALRNVDMQLVFWRMLLEYGRLMSQETSD